MEIIKSILNLFKSNINVVYDYDLIIEEERKLKKGEEKIWTSPLTGKNYKIYGKN